MAGNVDNMVLEQLKMIRKDLTRMEDKMDDMSTKVDGHTAILIGLGKYIHDIDGRVEHIEAKLGIEE